MWIGRIRLIFLIAINRHLRETHRGVGFVMSTVCTCDTRCVQFRIIRPSPMLRTIVIPVVHILGTSYPRHIFGDDFEGEHKDSIYINIIIIIIRINHFIWNAYHIPETFIEFFSFFGEFDCEIIRLPICFFFFIRKFFQSSNYSGVRIPCSIRSFIDNNIRLIFAVLFCKLFIIQGCTYMNRNTQCTAMLLHILYLN